MAMWQRFIDSLSPRQFCWLCLSVAVTIGVYGQRTYATSDVFTAFKLDVVRELNEIRIDQLSKAVFETREKQCRAILGGHQADAYTKLLTEAEERYVGKVGKRYPLPNCIELVQ